jgi:putative AdoMet-dependent methyltransferase
MRSQYADVFNHDRWADGYDADVKREEDPVRVGYDAVLEWTVAQAHIGPGDVVVDLGSGTGNTAAYIGPAAAILCVDISQRMAEKARTKLGHRPEVRFVQADLLGFVAGQPEPCDAVVSTYAVHHLTDTEKGELFMGIAQMLRPGGRAVFGDLMVENAAELARLTEHYRAVGDEDTAEALAEEFFWQVDLSLRQLAAAGLAVVEVRRFSDLSWGICVRKPAAGE